MSGGIQNQRKIICFILTALMAFVLILTLVSVNVLAATVSDGNGTHDSNGYEVHSGTFDWKDLIVNVNGETGKVENLSVKSWYTYSDPACLYGRGYGALFIEKGKDNVTDGNECTFLTTEEGEALFAKGIVVKQGNYPYRDYEWTTYTVDDSEALQSLDINKDYRIWIWTESGKYVMESCMGTMTRVKLNYYLKKDGETDYTYKKSVQTMSIIGAQFDANSASYEGATLDAARTGTLAVTTAKDQEYDLYFSANADFVDEFDSSDIIKNEYTGTFDGQSHEVSVSTTVEGATVTYCDTQDGTYRTEPYSFKDAGEHTVYYRVSKEGYSDVTGTLTANIEKKSLEVPTFKSSTNTGVVLNPVTVNGATAKYAVSTTQTAPEDENAWQADTTFNGLTGGTTYYFFVKCDDSNYKTSEPLAVTIVEDTEAVAGLTDITVTARNGYEYSIDGGLNWVSDDDNDGTVVFSDLDSYADYTIMARIAATGTSLASEAKSLDVKTLCSHDYSAATCIDKEICKICGEKSGEIDANNHTALTHVKAKAATKTSEGNIEYWHCDGCDKYFSDAKATKEIKKSDVKTEKLETVKKTEKTEKTSTTKAAQNSTTKTSSNGKTQTGDSNNVVLWLVCLLAGVAVITAAMIVRKKHNK